MPVPLYLSGVVIIFVFLDPEKNISFSDTLLDEKAGILEIPNDLLYKEQAIQRP